MKKLIVMFLLVFTALLGVNAQYNAYGNGYSSSSQRENATMTFRNGSDCAMVIKIIYEQGGLYRTLYLPERSSQVVKFSQSNDFRMKIKVTQNGRISYHDGGSFSVTCTSTQYSEGEISFMVSSMGTGLGPKISAQEFESNY